ncbi:MAG: D-alanyl-D-alanine carboxypeptidase, partial [Saprospiraceae bacterium]
TGDPTLLHPYFAMSGTIDFLKSKASTKKMFLSDGHSSLDHYGEGWMWDDYNGYYQPELSHLPMYGNVLKVKKDSIGLTITPMTLIQKSYASPSQRNIKRVLDDNIFIIPSRLDTVKSFDQEIPYKDASRVNHRLLEEALNTKIESIKIPVAASALTLYSMATDTVLRRMMQVSDNMLAEQLLILSGMISGDTLSSPYAIESISSRYLSDLSHRPIWKDGSGLTRYNMFTPQSILGLLLKMENEVGGKRLLSLLAYNGGNGTMRNMFYTQAQPYVFAKSGTLANVYNLSGYMVTPSGKKLAFSFMNNNFSGGSSGVKKEVERILEQARLMY